MCPACGEAAVSGASWCEACGADLDGPPPLPPCVDCGAPGEGIVGGYCSSCGVRQPGEHDHAVTDLGWLAAVTDKGARRAANEDAFAIVEAAGAAVLVVCDGVGSTDSPAAAARAGATAAAESLAERLAAGDSPTTIDMNEAAMAAQRAVVATAESTPASPGQLPPSATFVAAVARAKGETAGVSGLVGWLGDSRAYWIGADALRLTQDHVWDGPADHEENGSITRWLGSDAADVTPSTIDFDTEGDGLLVVCSDGLWRYLDDPADMAATVNRLRTEAPSTAALAKALVDFANERGGHDNITVAIADFESKPREIPQ